MGVESTRLYMFSQLTNNTALIFGTNIVQHCVCFHTQPLDAFATSATACANVKHDEVRFKDIRRAASVWLYGEAPVLVVNRAASGAARTSNLGGLNGLDGFHPTLRSAWNASSKGEGRGVGALLFARSGELIGASEVEPLRPTALPASSTTLVAPTLAVVEAPSVGSFNIANRVFAANTPTCHPLPSWHFCELRVRVDGPCTPRENWQALPVRI